MAEILFRLGRFAARRARLVVTAWVAVLALAGVAFAVGGGTLTTALTIPNTPTAEVTDQLEDEFPSAAGGTGTVVLSTEDGSELTQAQRDELSPWLAGVTEVDGVEGVIDPFQTEAERAEQQQALEDGLAQIEDGRAQIEQGRTQIEEGAAQLEDGRAQLDAARAELEQGQAAIDTAREQAEAAGALDQAAPQLDAQQAEVDAGLAQLEEQQTALEAQEAELEAGRAELEEQATALEEQATEAELGAQLLEGAAEIRLVSEDGSAAIANLSFSESQFEITQETKDEVMEVLGAPPVDGVESSFGADIATATPELLGVGEAVGVVVAAIVLLIMLGTLIGAGLPILTALIGVGIGALGALSLSGVVEMVSVTPVLGLMLGLAVGIDYSLFIINRHRRQLKQGYDVEESIGLANGTSGNAVVFAGATVLIALLGLNITGIPFLGLMGTVAAFCVAIAVAIAVTMTPALLSLVGARILSTKERAALPGAAGATGAAAPSPVATARPMSTTSAVARVVLGAAALVVIALPALDLRLGLPDGSSEPSDSTQYQAYETVTEKFGDGQNGTLLAVAEVADGAGEDLGTQVAIAQQLFSQDDVVAVAPVGASEDGGLVAFQVVPAEGPTSESTEQLVTDLRELTVVDGDATFGIAGAASGSIDVSQALADALPTYLAVVVGLSMVILVLVFRSIYVPVIATLGFILSFFAALGGVVAIYQWGWLGGVFGVESPGPVLNFLPTILVGILFGLAMDYMLFLGTGMREAYAHGAPARLAVAQGFRAGRAVVTAAAIIMISVFGGFIFAHSAMIRPIGFALAFGVLVDAFVVRMLLIPALMHLAGDKAWWLPRWLDRILPDVDVEGAKLERRHPHVEVEHTAASSTGETAGNQPGPVIRG